MITNDPRGKWAGPCGWCGDKCGNKNVCEPVVWLKRNGVTEFEDCLKEEETTTTTTATGMSTNILDNNFVLKTYIACCLVYFKNVRNALKNNIAIR